MARRSQRIELSEPIHGSFGAIPVAVIDLSADGASIEHAVPLPVNTVERLKLTGRFEVSGVIRHSVVTRVGTDLGGRRYRTGLAFQRTSDDVQVVIESILMDEAMRVVRLWEANASGLTSSPAIAALQRQSANRSPGGYVWMRLVGDRWKRSVSLDPNQPLDGFAVDAGEDRGQIILLCRTYKAASDDGRAFIRSLAQLAIAERLCSALRR